MVKGAPEPTNVNQANAKQVTSPASVSPVEDAVVVKYVNLGLSNDMRGGYDKLCGVVRSLGEDPDDGTAYVFTSKNQKIVKIIRHEHNECQMYYGT